MKTFGERCQEVADELGIELVDVYHDEEPQDSFEDDGILHIMNGTMRYAFDVSNNQKLSVKAQNKITKEVMRNLGLKVTERVLA